MTITSRFTYLPDGFTFEVVEYEDGMREYVLMPRTEASSEEPQEPVLAPSLLEVESPVVSVPPTRKRRSLWGLIRATWFVLFTAMGEALTYGLNNLTSLNLPPGTATAIGAVGYGLKRGLWPSSTI